MAEKSKPSPPGERTFGEGFQKSYTHERPRPTGAFPTSRPAAPAPTANPPPNPPQDAPAGDPK